MDKMRHLMKKKKKTQNNYGYHNCPQLLVSFSDLSKTSAFFFPVFLFSQHMLDHGQFEVSKDVFSSTS